MTIEHGNESGVSSSGPDWDRIERDVVRKLHYLHAAWEETAKAPDLHKAIVRDLYLPALAFLAGFCTAIEEEKN